LEKLNIIPDDKGIFLKSDHAERAATTSVLGQDKLWSSLNLYRQLELLETLVPTTVSKSCYTLLVCLKSWQNEACARVWIDAFFFRASAMLPSDKHMVLSMEQVVPQITVRPSSSTTLSGFIDYTAVTANERLASKLILLHWGIRFDSLFIRNFPFRSGACEIQNHAANWFFRRGSEGKVAPTYRPPSASNK